LPTRAKMTKYEQYILVERPWLVGPCGIFLEKGDRDLPLRTRGEQNRSTDLIGPA
jgi:hypothetical protein